MSYRQKDGTFLPDVLLKIKPPKSYEYLIMHCSNYASGALSMLDQDFDFQSTYFDAFLDAEYLDRWLKQRSFSRPWEESNNIVNVASYLAMCNDAGDGQGRERLYQMLEWHNEYQNSKTGGFDNFLSASRKNIRQSMAGAVHNFHIHHYLGEPIRFEDLIATNVTEFLFEGPLTACLSIDFVELACHTLQYVENKGEVVSSLLCHLDSLLNYQNEDGGWFEAAASGRPTSANGMRETQASSCSYATWFRLVSIGMIEQTCLDNSGSWNYRDTLGMGAFWGGKQAGSPDFPLVISNVAKRKFLRKSLGGRAKERAIEFAAKLM
ncbi:hypothetical protein N9B33_03920 [Akkermansiaceae bacterium]|nr:hypothetical protein [Akkermansiaceae bacterium]MDB4790220.1 hypothetical protein [Akkermansiaceae bacterium]